MSESRSASASAPVRVEGVSSPVIRRSLLAALWLALGAIVLIGSEIWLVAVAFGWALDGLLGLNMVGDAILALFIGPPTLWATWMTIRLAVEAERTLDS